MNTNQIFSVRRNVCLIAIGFISVVQATVPPIPKGIFSMPAAEANGFPDLILNDTRIIGLDLGGSWADFESTEGVYDWSAVDSELAKAEAHGKKVLLRIVSGGINVPDWLLANPDVQTFTFIDTNPYSPTYGQQLTMPVYWDSIFLAKKIALIQAAGAHFASHSSITVVACSFTNSTTGDWSIPDSPEDIPNWLAAGYTTALMVNSAEMIIDATMAAFPNQNVTLSIGRGAGDLDPTADYLAETVVNYATTTYGRFITEKNSLCATTADPGVDFSSLFNWQVLFDQCPNVAAQMLWFVSGDNTYRMNGGIAGIPATILLNAVTIGAHFGTRYQEIYEADLKDPTLSSVITTANTLLTVTPPSPSAPSNLNGTASDPWSVNLTWNDNANNELGYRIQSKIGATGTYGLVITLGPNTTATTITSLLEGTQYYFRLQGVNAGGVSGYSNEASLTTILNAPATLIAQALSSSQVLLNWTDTSATETGFKIERSPLTDTNYTQIATVGADTTSFTDSGLSEATKYWYRVRAYNAYTTSAYSTERQVTTLYNIPAAPSGLRITSLLSNQVSLSWTDHSGDESGFKIQRKQGATGTYVTIKTTAANVTSYTDRDTALKDGTLYYYRVCATNAAGDSAFSNEASGTTPLAKPTSATATAVSSSQINLAWIDNSVSETGYLIERKTGVGGTYAQIAQVVANVQNYSDTNGLQPNTRYYYRIRATNGTVNSDYSNEASAVTFQVTSTPTPTATATATFTPTPSATSTFTPTPTATATFTPTPTPSATATATATAIPTSTPTATATATATVPPTPTATPTPTPTAAPTPAPPTALNASNETTSSFTANWTSVSGATGYRLDVSISNSFVTYVPGYQNLDVGNITSRNVTGLTANTFYYYRVRAYNGNGTSPNSNVIKAKTTPH